MFEKKVFAGCCPKCGGQLKTPFTPLIDVQTHPEQRERVLSGTFFAGKCRKCGYTGEIMAPCLYFDACRRAMIYLIPDYAEAEWRDSALEKCYPETGAFTKRVVSSVPQLKEKIQLLEAGLDDRIVELAKLAVAGWASKRQRRRIREAYFAELDEAENRICFYLYTADDPEPILYRARIDIYEASRAVAEAAPAGTAFRNIDLRWAAYTLADYHRRNRVWSDVETEGEHECL